MSTGVFLDAWGWAVFQHYCLINRDNTLQQLYKYVLASPDWTNTTLELSPLRWDQHAATLSYVPKIVGQNVFHK